MRRGAALRRPDARDRTGPSLTAANVDHRGLRFTLLRRPEREEIVVPVDEQLVVEHYSR
ncbi:hypothetical protein ACQP2K_16055 [Microbispora siamensis]